MFKGLLSILFVASGSDIYKEGTIHPSASTLFGKAGKFKVVYVDNVNKLILTESEMEQARKRFVDEEVEALKLAKKKFVFLK